MMASTNTDTGTNQAKRVAKGSPSKPRGGRWSDPSHVHGIEIGKLSEELSHELIEEVRAALPAVGETDLWWFEIYDGGVVVNNRIDLGRFISEQPRIDQEIWDLWWTHDAYEESSFDATVQFDPNSEELFVTVYTYDGGEQL